MTSFTHSADLDIEVEPTLLAQLFSWMEDAEQAKALVEIARLFGEFDGGAGGLRQLEFIAGMLPQVGTPEEVRAVRQWVEDLHERIRETP